MPAPCPEMVREIERITSRRDAHGDMIDTLTREVSDLRCILREIRDLSTEEEIRALASSRLVQ